MASLKTGAIPSVPLNEAKTNQLIDLLVELYSPELAKAGIDPMPMVDWQDRSDDLRVKFDGYYHNIIVARGAVARMNPDVAAVRLCHELGHLAGAGPREDPHRTTAEGEADYFSGQAMEKLIRVGALSPAGPIPEADAGMLRAALLERGADVNDAVGLKAKMRAAYAALQSLRMLPGGEDIAPTRPDPSVVEETLFDYPSLQARLDSVLAGLAGAPRPRSWAHPRDF